MEWSSGTILSVEGHFDQGAALHLRKQLMNDAASEVTVDFSHVKEFDDATLSLLSVNLIALQRRGRKVLLRGLRDHQISLLDHFGILIRHDGAVEASDAETPFTD